MKKTTKVTLLSILVFPGIGHLILKKYVIALAFITSFAYLLLGLVGDITDKSQKIIDSLISGEIPLEINAISEALIKHDVLGSQQQTFAGYLLVLIWFIAAFDAYRIAKKMDKNLIN